ncbi:MAG: cytosine permease [Proteobacteria bacterium]|nr:cytosine permease [Pseudomonadota bacterium]
MIEVANSRQSLRESDPDFTRCPVPDNKTISWRNIAVVIFGIGITLPVFFVGSELNVALGFKDATIVLFFGCAIIAVMMAATSVVAARTRLSTYMILQFTFGATGVKPVNILLAITYLGYFAATGDIFGRAIHDSLQAFYGWDVPVTLCATVGSAVMSLTAVFGFSVVERFSTLAVPILAAFMMYVVYLASQQTEWDALLAIPGQGGINFGQAISIVIGTNILMAVAAPDFTRFSKNDREAVKTVTGLALGYPLIMLASGIPTLVTGEIDIMKIMISLKIAVPALTILVFATWTTNTVNLYAGILTLATVFKDTRTWKIALASSVIGTVGAALGVMDYFLPFVFFLGIATSPVAGIYLADFFVLHGGKRDFADLEQVPAIGFAAYVSWLAGSGVAYMTTYTSATITTIPAVDGLLVAFLVYLAWHRLRRVGPRRASSLQP